LLDGESCVGDDSAERAQSDLLVVGNHDPGVRLVAAEDHVAAVLAAENEPARSRAARTSRPDRSDGSLATSLTLRAGVAFGCYAASHNRPHGDQGGNEETVVPATGEPIKLHAYWDRLLGSYSTPEGAIRDALLGKDTKLPDPDPALVMKADSDEWFKESEKLFAYAEPVKSGMEPYMLDRQYETNARNIARQQAALAGTRLANLINEALK
jgi:hypothetical protein